MRSMRGFTLLELLIAFVIASFALGILFQAASGGMLLVHAAGRYEEAVSRATSHLAPLERDAILTEGETSGDDGGGFHWHLAITPVAGLTLPSADAAAPGARLPTLFSIEVAILWTENERRREVVLRTERMALPADRGAS
ncbi:MAG TPA: prepilin-type N-terminal cleavage/methylation domain-containing protein [Aliidongia sp.]|nr:prepilin-type N-terminal cleavage/methylation domain-containing protein [Aliidongia sp.]